MESAHLFCPCVARRQAEHSAVNFEAGEKEIYNRRNRGGRFDVPNLTNSCRLGRHSAVCEYTRVYQPEYPGGIRGLCHTRRNLRQGKILWPAKRADIYRTRVETVRH